MELTWSDFFEEPVSEMCLYHVYVCLCVCVCEKPDTVPDIYGVFAFLSTIPVLN